jgi:hypothetical protein
MRTRVHAAARRRKGMVWQDGCREQRSKDARAPATSESRRKTKWERVRTRREEDPLL